MRGDLSAVIKHLNTGADEIIFDVFCVHARMFCEPFKSGIEVEE